MSNDYNDKSWTERANWILTVIALALVAILSVGLLCALFIRPQDEEEEAIPKDGAIISETAANGISLMSAKIMPVAYAENGVSALADTAYTLTATVEPDYSGEKEFDWSVKFQNASSSWANGKTVTDYVTVTPTSDGSCRGGSEHQFHLLRRNVLVFRVRLMCGGDLFGRVHARGIGDL